MTHKNQRIYSRTWYMKNKAESNARSCVWREKNIEASKESSRNWYRENKAKARESIKAWRKKNPERVAFMAYKRGAKERGIEFNLTRDEFMSFWQKPCHYTGRPIAKIGVDRIDSEKGYSPENVVPCCYEVNIAKMTTGADTFIQMCREVVTVADRSKTSPK